MKMTVKAISQRVVTSFNDSLWNADRLSSYPNSASNMSFFCWEEGSANTGEGGQVAVEEHVRAGVYIITVT